MASKLACFRTNYDEDELDKIFQQKQKGVWKGERLSDLFNNYQDNSLLVVDFCSAIDGCLKRAGHLESFIKEACRKFKDEYYSNGKVAAVKDYSRTLQELRNNVRMVGDPFTADFFEVFNSIYSHQILLKKRLHNRSGQSRTWRKVWDIILAVAKPLLCKKYLGNLRRQRELKGSMQRGVYVVVNSLYNIGRMAEMYRSRIENFFLIVDYIMLRGDVVGIGFAVQEIKRSLGELLKINHDLSEHVNYCRVSLRLLNNQAAKNQDIGMLQEEHVQSRIIEQRLEELRPLRTAGN